MSQLKMFTISFENETVFENKKKSDLKLSNSRLDLYDDLNININKC